MTSIGSMSSSYSTTTASMGAHRGHRPDPSKMASKLFSQLDTSNKGYIEKSDLQSALDSVSGSSNSSTSSSTSSTSDKNSADALFSKLDGNGDGKVTQDEMSSGLKQLADELDSQFSQMRMQGGMGQMGQAGGMPPPPPPEKDSGVTKDKLSQSSSSSSSSASSSQASGDTQLLKQIMELMKAYGQQDKPSQAQNSFSQMSSLLSVTA
ncbi:MAG: hypothetical protein RIR18_2241 [Pseudomonadota bacterium]|jgi:Ca2+-binding EF-hand superfamily protein